MQYNPFYYIERLELMHYEYVWVNYVKKDVIVENTIPEEIIRSWVRCKRSGVNAMLRSIPQIKIENIESNIKKNQETLYIAIPIMEMLINLLDEKGLSAGIADSEGYILWNLHNDSLMSDTNHPFNIGQNVNEMRIGTNGYDLAIRHTKPIEVVGAEHYCEILHKKAEYVAPVLDKHGNLVLVVGISVNMEKSNRYMLGMISAAAKAIENEFQLKEVHLQLLHHNEMQKKILDSVTDGIVYIDDKNMITHANLEMVNMTGIKSEDMIGKSINIIQTNPKINTLIASIRKGVNIGKVRINGRVKSYNCIVKYRYVESNDPGSYNLVLFFTKYEEIQELADQMSQENRAFFTFDDINGKSIEILDCIRVARKAAEHNVRILIEGESGTGKEMFAQAIHNYGPRKKGPFVAVDCGAIPRELLESELFGYEEGAYTGARRGGQRGKFEVAHGGTLFLDEISNMPIDMQSKLLRVLQENKILKIGGYQPISIDVQVIAATNKDLFTEVEKGNFREDLLYRLNTVHIKLPALRDRKEDIPIFINQIIQRANSQFNKTVRGADDRTVSTLMKYDWPGNVRQLSNVVEHMVLMSNKNILIEELIPEEIKKDLSLDASIEFPSKLEPLEIANARYIKHVIDECGGNIKKASELLEISRATVYRILRKNDLI
jgi:transcriptional regulator with PAS, ATPase and Fis domain